MVGWNVYGGDYICLRYPACCGWDCGNPWDFGKLVLVVLGNWNDGGGGVLCAPLAAGWGSDGRRVYRAQVRFRCGQWTSGIQGGLFLTRGEPHRDGLGF